jgi:hypothetical protein
MFKDLFKITISIIILGVIGCGQDFNSVGQRNPFVNSPLFSKTPFLKWKPESFPLKISLSEDFRNDFFPEDRFENNLNVMDKMLETWDLEIKDNVLFELPTPLKSNRDYETLIEYKDKEIGIYKSYQWFEELHTGTLAVTQYFGVRKNKGTPYEYLELLHADIVFNYRDFFFTTHKLETSEYDLPSVLLHEIGHLLGLPHENKPQSLSVMRPYLGPSDVQRTLFERDKINLGMQYPSQNSSSIVQQNGPPSSPKKESPPPLIERGVIELNARGECWSTLGSKKTLLHIH